RVLGVDGHDLVGALPRGAHERTADDERLLVRQGEGRPGAQGGEGRLEADGAGDAVEDDVAAGTGELGGGVGADADVDVGHGPAALGGDGGDGGAHVVGVPAGDADERDVVVEDLLGEEAEVPAA